MIEKRLYFRFAGIEGLVARVVCSRAVRASLFVPDVFPQDFKVVVMMVL